MRLLIGTTILGFAAGLVVDRLRLPSDAGEDYFVITSTKPSHGEAQQEAALTGGWVVNTNLYPNLTDGLFAVVRGPFATLDDATLELNFLQSRGDYPDAYVRNAGELLLPPGISGNAPPAMAAALLGELRFVTEAHPGAENPCEPQRPYHRVELVWYETGRVYDPDAGGVRRGVVQNQVPFGGFWWIDDTGEVEHMRVCSE